MNKEFIPYEQILEIKTLGFDGILWQEAFRWFRDKRGLYSTIEIDQTMEPMFCYSLSRYNGNYQWDNILPTYSELYYTYEEAELACLKKLIEIVNGKQ